VIITPEFAPIIGGVAHAVTRFSIMLANYGFHVIVVTFQHMDLIVERNIGRGRLTIVYVKSYGKFVFGFSLIKLLYTVVKLLRKTGKPLVIVGEVFGFPTLISALLSKLFHIPSMARGHGSDVDVVMLSGKSIVVKLSLMFNTLLLGTNLNYVLKIRKVSKRSDVMVLHNVVMPRAVDEFTKIVIRQKLGFADGVHCLIVARLVDFKGVDVAVKAFTLLKDKQIFLHIFGDGPLRSWLEKFIEENGLSNRVFLHGKKSNRLVLEYMRSCDIFIMPSRREGLSSAILEALSCGMPIIASNVGGNKFVVINGFNGFLYSVESYEELAKAIMLLAQNEKLRKLMGERSLYIWKSSFSPQAIIKQFIRVVKVAHLRGRLKLEFEYK
jgi:glycosyltransferase involved in cell wall biosynthesis